MLYFDKDEVVPTLESEGRKRCAICEERVAPWKTLRRDSVEKVPCCGWCLLYSNETRWGYLNRDELASVGKGAVAVAARANKDLPILDQRHRLSSTDAERFVAGIFATSRALRGPLGRFARKTAPRG